MILQLKKGYLDVDYFRDKFGVDIVDHWRDAWSDYESEGLVRMLTERGRIELTRHGLVAGRRAAAGLLRAAASGCALHLSWADESARKQRFFLVARFAPPLY